MFRLLVIFTLLASPLSANQLEVIPDTLYCDSSLHVAKSFCPHCEAWNDIFSPDFTGKIPVVYHMTICDEDGTEVFSSANIEEGWNGLVKESDVHMSSFYWKITYQYEKEGPLYSCNGTFALIQ